MKWTFAPIFFPDRVFDSSQPEDRPIFLEAFLTEFFARYSVDVRMQIQYLGDTPVTQSPTEDDEALATIFPDDDPLTRFRKASIFDGTLPFERADGGYILRCWWLETFIADINRDPQPEPEWFDGIKTLPQ